MRESSFSVNPLQITKSDPGREDKLESEVKFTKQVGCDGALVMIGFFSIGGSFMYIVFFSTANFRVFSRWPTYIFLILSALYIGVGANFVLRWHTIANRYRSEFSKKNSPTNNAGKRSRKRANLGIINVILRFEKIHRSLAMNSPYFLWKLYFVEIFGYVIQLFNFITLYLCTLPPWFNISLSTLFMIEALFRAIAIRRNLTVKLRDAMVKVDIFLDVVDSMAPLSVIHTLQIRIPVQESIQILVWPAVSLLFKLRSILLQILRKRAADSSDRRSFNFQTFTTMATRQQQTVPVPVRHGIFVLTVVYAFFMAFLAVWISIADSIATEECKNPGGRVHME